MSLYSIIFLGVFLLAHSFFALRFTKQIYQSPRFKLPQKRVNTIMTWLIPFLWFLLIKPMLTSTVVMTKSKRKKQIDFPRAEESEYVA